MIKLFFCAEIQGSASVAALQSIIGRDDITIVVTDSRTLVYGDISSYVVGWVLDRCSWFGRVGVIIPENKLPQWSPSKDKGA